MPEMMPFHPMMLQGHPMMGGQLPPQQSSYNGGINPGGMYTGGNLPAQGGMQMGGQMPPQQFPQMGMGGSLPPMGYPQMHTGGGLPPMHRFQPRGFNFFGPGHP